MLAVCLLFLVGTAVSAPDTYERWIEIKPPEDLVLSYRPYEDAWVKFKHQHGKSYSAQEELHRYNVFLDNVAYIESHNKLYMAGQKSFYLGLNHLADWELEEFRRLGGFQHHINVPQSTRSSFLRSSMNHYPKHIDWRDHGYVTPVKNQENCSAGWAFSATGGLEGQHFKKTKKLVSLSEQQLMDCIDPYYKFGCHGGLVNYAFDFIRQRGGIDTEASYPYVAKREKTCKFNRTNIGSSCSGYADVDRGDEYGVYEDVAVVGPISITIDARHRSFQFYAGGVYDEPKCSSTSVNHGVLIVGYGVTDKGLKYWIVKNSWTVKWGMEGYIWMSRFKHNQCGVAFSATFPYI